MAGQGLKTHNKAQKAKAMAKRAAAANKSKAQGKKVVMAKDKVEHTKVQATVQENAVKNIAETSVPIYGEVGKNVVKDQDLVALSDYKVIDGDTAAVSLSVDAHDEVPNATEIVIKPEGSSNPLLPSLFEKLDLIAGRRVDEDFLFASKETPQQFLNRIGHACSDTTEKIQPWDGERERETSIGATRAVDGNGFECIGFRAKDTVQDAPAAKKVLSVDQLFAMFQSKDVETPAAVDTAEVAQPLGIVEEDVMPTSIYSLSTIAEVDSESVSPRTGSISEYEDTSQSSVASTLEDTELFSRSVTPFTNTAKKEKVIVRLPSPSGISSSPACRALKCTEAGAALYREAIVKDADIPFNPATTMSRIIVHHNAGELPTSEQIKAAFIFTCPDETLEISSSVTASPTVEPAIASSKENKSDIQVSHRVLVDIADPAILSAFVKQRGAIRPATLTSKVMNLSPTAAVFTPSGAQSLSSPTSLQEASDILKAALGINTTQDSSSRRTSHSLPTPKDMSGPQTPDTPTLKASLVNNILSRHCENDFIPTKQHNVTAFAANGSYDYRDAAPGQYWPEQAYAQYQQPYVYPGSGGFGYNPYDGVPEYYQTAWDAVQYGM